MSTNPIIIDQDAAIVAFKSQLLNNLTFEQKEQLLNSAISEILRLKESGYNRNNLAGDAMRSSITNVMTEVLSELFEVPENKKRLIEAAQSAMDALIKNIEMKLQNEVMSFLTKGY